MNSFFRITIYFAIALIMFTLSVNFISSLSAFPIETEEGPQIDSTDSALQVLTGLEQPNMAYIWLGVTTVGGFAAVGLAWLTKSVVPIGLYIYSLVFWTSWMRCQPILNFAGYMPPEFLLIFTVGVMFIFIASIIGLLTGGG